MDSNICNSSLRVYTRQITGNIVKVTYTYDQVEPEYSILITEEMKKKEGYNTERYSVLEEGLAFKNERDMVILKETSHYLEEKDIFHYLIDGKPIMKVKQTANGEVSELLIYTGENGEFTLYNDEGDNYSYESGNYSAIPLCYREEDRSLTFGKVKGGYTYQENFRIRTIEPDGREIVSVYRYEGEEGIVHLV